MLTTHRSGRRAAMFYGSENTLEVRKQGKPAHVGWPEAVTARLVAELTVAWLLDEDISTELPRGPTQRLKAIDTSQGANSDVCCL